MWEHGFLGSEKAELLRDTLVWVLGVQFTLRTRQEHGNFETKKFTVVFTVQCDKLGREFLQYTEDISKTNNEGLSHCVSKGKLFGHIRI